MSDGVLVRLAPEDLLVRKNARFTHDRMNFHHDVHGKRFNAHGESHNMEKTISKDHVAEKPGRGLSLLARPQDYDIVWRVMTPTQTFVA